MPRGKKLEGAIPFNVKSVCMFEAHTYTKASKEESSTIYERFSGNKKRPMKKSNPNLGPLYLSVFEKSNAEKKTNERWEASHSDDSHAFWGQIETS